MAKEEKEEKAKKEKKNKGEKSTEKKAKKRKTIDPSDDAEPQAMVVDVNPETAEGEENGTADGVPRKVLLSPISTPLADDKLKKRILKLVKKAAKRKQLKRGVKEVVKALRKDVKGVCVIAGDISPIDVITHLPIMCEDRDIPYVYVPSKEELGAAGQTKRPSSCMLILPKPLKGGADDDEAKEYAVSYEDVYKRMKAAQVTF